MFHIPRFAVRGDESVVCECDVLGVKPHGKSEMPFAVVGIWAVEQLVVEMLSRCFVGGKEESREPQNNI